jgi:hypothetical protein
MKENRAGSKFKIKSVGGKKTPAGDFLAGV